MKKDINNKGFSLVELIITIAVMVVLAGVLAIRLIGYIEKSRESKDLQDISNIKSAIHAYVAEKAMDPGNEIIINIEGGSVATLTIEGSGYTPNALKDVGIDDTFYLGSKKWDDIVMTYNMVGQNYQWTCTPSEATAGGKHYYYDGTAK